MDFYEKNGIIPYINAHDTYTMYGGEYIAGDEGSCRFFCGS